MSVQKANVLVPPLRSAPPAAAWIGAAASWLIGVEARLQSAFAAWIEASRAQRKVDRAARDDARSRGELIAMARRYERTQPEFAKDLYAAACCDRQI
jgi:hypothetical protein